MPRRDGWMLALLLLLGALGCGGRESQGARPDATAAATAAPEAPPAPSGPPKRIFARRFVVTVRIGPNEEAARIGYLRGGAVLQAKTAEPVGHEGCRGGWYELETGGFVCSGRDVIAFEGSRLPAVRGVQPDLEANLPYPYAYVRSRVPMYRNLPSLEDVGLFEHAGPSATEASPTSGVPSVDAGIAAEETSTLTNATATAVTGKVGEGLDAGVATLDGLAGKRDSLVMRWLTRGFYVSLDREFERAGRRYWRTQGNGFIPHNALATKEGSDFHGVPLDGETWALPVAFVTQRGAVAYEKTPQGRVRAARGPAPDHRTAVRVVARETHGPHEYVVGADGRLFRLRDVRIIDAGERPAEIAEGLRWIDVDLAQQSVVAYEGTRPVFVTLISSGRVTREGVPEFDHRTPTGIFEISSKHLTHTMDGDHAIDGPYSIDDVPYVMYFQLANAFHSAFWHDRFGRPKSHGCVNMSPLDAKWLFAWVTPTLPVGWHGAYPAEGAPRTWVHIHGETPKG